MLTPIIVTWLAISEAVAAYHRLLSAQPDESQKTFLFLWQGGFDGELSSWFRLSRVAAIDCIVILLVVLLTILLDRFQRSGNVIVEQAAIDRRLELAAAVTDAALCLRLGVAPGPAQFQTQLAAVARQLTGVSASIIEGAQDSRELAVAVGGAAAGSAEAAKAFVEGLERVSRDMARVEERLEKTRAADTAREKRSQESDARLQAVVVDLRSFAGALEASIKAIANGSAALAAAADRIGKEADARAKFVSDLSAERVAQEALAQLVSRSVTGLEGALREIGDYSTTLHGLAVDLAELGRVIPGHLDDIVDKARHIQDANVEAVGKLAKAIIRIEMSAAQVQEMAQRADRQSQ
jgi:hypothetical protein